MATAAPIPIVVVPHSSLRQFAAALRQIAAREDAAQSIDVRPLIGHSRRLGLLATFFERQTEPGAVYISLNPSSTYVGEEEESDDEGDGRGEDDEINQIVQRCDLLELGLDHVLDGTSGGGNSDEGPGDGDLKGKGDNSDGFDSEEDDSEEDDSDDDDNDGFGEDEIEVSEYDLKLPPNSLIKVSIAKRSINNPIRTYFGTGITLAHPVSGQQPGQLYARMTFPAGVRIPTSATNVRVLLVDDIDTMLSMTTSLQQIQNTPVRGDGWHIGEVAYNAQPFTTRRIEYVTDAQVECFLKASTDYICDGRRVGLHRQQLDALFQCLTTDNGGLVLVDGIPGGGKTVTAVCATKGFTALGHTVLFCAATDAGVVVAKDYFRDNIGNTVFAYMRSSTVTLEGIITAGACAASNVQHTLSPRPLAAMLSGREQRHDPYESPLEDDFVYKKLCQIFEWAGQDVHQLQGVAKQYIDLVRTALGGVSAVTAEMHQDFERLDGVLTSAFIKTIRVVFCTVAWARDRNLVASFKPKVIVLDMAGMVASPAVVHLLASYQEACKIIVLVGDSVTERPRLALRRNRPAVRLLFDTPFLRICREIRQRESKFKRWLLRIPHRLHDDLREGLVEMYESDPDFWV